MSMAPHGPKHLQAAAMVSSSMLPVVDRVESSPHQTLSICISLAMQAVHEKAYSIASINHLVVGGWCLYSILVVGERLDRSLHQRLSLGTSLDMHAFHEGISTAAWTKPHAGWWLVSCGALVVRERLQLTDNLLIVPPALLGTCTHCTKRYTMPHAPNTLW
jgi:hypothetical protein